MLTTFNKCNPILQLLMAVYIIAVSTFTIFALTYFIKWLIA